MGTRGFWVAERTKIIEETMEICVSDEDQELLGEVTAEKTHASVEECDGPVEDVGEHNLKKLPPDTNESLGLAKKNKVVIWF